MKHDHAHNHSHSHALKPTHPQHHWAFFFAILFNLGFVVVEFIYGIKANSMSLLADAGHNLGDVLGLAFSWLASWLLVWSASERFSYGLKRITILAALVNALILVATAAIISVETITKFFHPSEINEWTVIVVALIGVAINAGTAVLFISSRHEDLNIKSAFLHLAYDALISLGVVVGGVIILYTGWLMIDPILGLFIVLAILLGTWGLLRDSVNLILDGVPHKVDHQAVRKYLCNFSGVTAIHDLHIWGLSTHDIALTAHLIMPDSSLSDADYQMIQVEMRERFSINHVTLQVERGTGENACEQGMHC